MDPPCQAPLLLFAYPKKKIFIIFIIHHYKPDNSFHTPLVQMLLYSKGFFHEKSEQQKLPVDSQALILFFAIHKFLQRF